MKCFFLIKYESDLGSLSVVRFDLVSDKSFVCNNGDGGGKREWI